jgi:hypothetical protein
MASLTRLPVAPGEARRVSEKVWTSGVARLAAMPFDH